MVDARIEIGLLGDQRDPRAPAAGVRDGHAGRDPGALGHRVGGNHAALDGPGERDDPQGPSLQLAIGLFFAGGKEAVEIDVQLLRGGGLPHRGTLANRQRIHKPQERYSKARADWVGDCLGHPGVQSAPMFFLGCFRHQLLLHSPYLVLTKSLRLDIQCQRGSSVKIGWKYLDD